MHILHAGTEAQIKGLQYQSTLVPSGLGINQPAGYYAPAAVKTHIPNLLPPDRITPIRIQFYQLRLAKSDIFSPKLYLFQEAVDHYMKSREDDIFRTKTSSNNFTSIERTYANAHTAKAKGALKDADWDSGFSDG